MTDVLIPSLAGQDFLTLKTLSKAEFNQLLDSAITIKEDWKAGVRPEYLKHKTIAMIFEKQSLRTRSTMDIAMLQLGGHSVLLSQNYIGWGVRETIRDVASNLSRWVDGIMARTYGHDTLEELAHYATVPVINGLSDKLHPCQIVADFMALKETFGSLDGLKLTFVGDGNNVAATIVEAAALTGVAVTIACPEGYEPEQETVEWARANGGDITISHDPREAIKGADALYTDVWISMGMEAEEEQRRRDFAGYTITPEWFNDLSPRGVFMHDLPAHYGEECTEEAVYHERSIVFDQSENRLHGQKAVLLQLLQDTQ